MRLSLFSFSKDNIVCIKKKKKKREDEFIRERINTLKNRAPPMISTSGSLSCVNFH